MRSRGFVAAAVVVLVTTTGCSGDDPGTERPVAGASARSSATGPACADDSVSHGPLPAAYRDTYRNGTPGAAWLADGAMAAILVYAQGGRSSRIPVGGDLGPGRQTKVLWLTAEDQDAPLALVARQLTGGRRTLRQELTGTDNFPSLVVLPARGCWRLSLTTQDGETLGSIDLQAVRRS